MIVLLFKKKVIEEIKEMNYSIFDACDLEDYENIKSRKFNNEPAAIKLLNLKLDLKYFIKLRPEYSKTSVNVIYHH